MLCCGYTLTDCPISIRLTSLALWQFLNELHRGQIYFLKFWLHIPILILVNNYWLSTFELGKMLCTSAKLCLSLVVIQKFRIRNNPVMYCRLTPKMHFPERKWQYFVSNFTEICSWRSYWQAGSTQFNSLRPRPNRRHFADDIFKCIFENENEWFRLGFHWSLFLGLELTIFQHWFR